ncbi:putative tail spike 1 [Vibrio phage 284E43-1]|nr:putative tail spike 1 [Vibrio phage 284E43-1]
MSARFIRYTLDGIKLTHDIGFGVTDDDGFDVYVNRTKLDKGLDYDVIGSVDELRKGNGKITLKAAHAASDVLLILSDTLARRVTNFAKAARFEEAEIDNEFDNLLRLLEDAALNLQSTPYFDPADIGLVDGKLPPIIAGGVLRINANGNGFELILLDELPELQEIIREATEQADRSESEANRSESEAEKSESEANRSGSEADRAQGIADALGIAPSGDYKGLWPDSGGAAEEGDTWQTQTDGSPTGRYFAALKNTVVDPVGDDVNWREVVSGSSIGVQEVTATGSTTPRSLADRFADSYNVRDFGAIVDGVADDTAALKLAIKKINNYKETSATKEECQSYRYAKSKKLVIDGVLRYTERLHIPSGVEIVTAAPQSYFSKDVKAALFYDPVDKNTAAVSTLVYKKNAGGTYDIYEDINSFPAQGDFDDTTLITSSWSCKFDFNLITATGVQIGLWHLGGNSTLSTALSIGDANGNVPKVGLCFSSSWGSKFVKPNILATTQMIVGEGSNAGVAIHSPYLSRTGEGDFNNPMIFKPTGMLKDGAVGITLLRQCSITVNNPIIEQCYIANVVSGLSELWVNKPHYETSGGLLQHCYYVYEGSVEIHGTGLNPTENYLSSATSSIFYVQDCIRGAHRVVSHGPFDYFNCRLLLGSNSEDVVTVNDISESQFRFGNLGDISLLNAVENIDSSLTVHISSTGDDSNWGLNGLVPVQSMEAAIARLELFGLSDLYIQDYVNIDSVIPITKPVKFTVRGNQMYTLSGGNFLIHADSSIALNNASLTAQVTAPFVVTDNAELNLSLYGNVGVASQAALVSFRDVGVLALNIVNSNVRNLDAGYVSVAANSVGIATINVKADLRNTAYDTDATIPSEILGSIKARD